MQNTITLIFILLLKIGYSQNSIINGVLLDKNTNESLSYVNIGVLKKGIGTVSKSNGSFSLNIKHIQETDTVKFSALGYKPLIFSVKNLVEKLNNNPNLKMEENIEVLDEVIIVSKKEWKEKTLGSETKSTSMTMGFSSNLGSELGRRINISRKHTHILKFKANVALNTYKSIKLRLNFYTIKNGLPNEKINRENIYVNFFDKSGSLTVDLEKYKLVVSDDIIVTLEWVDNYGDGQFRISSRLGTSGIKQKDASLDSWRTLPFTLGYNILVRY
ncbi:Outer membrane protein with a CnaB-type/M14 peptidase domain [Tenacibaculum litopenaei]|uniref:carboxypeptidase-like regulatory domain-containing protein n=1 Tax=Tenacibaculum litopenaei TaxID=396016 RepID=UPI0038935F77